VSAFDTDIHRFRRDFDGAGPRFRRSDPASLSRYQRFARSERKSTSTLASIDQRDALFDHSYEPVFRTLRSNDDLS